MKKKLIIVLACVNAALLAALMLGLWTPGAQAQVVGGGADYMMLTAHIGSDFDAVYIVELGTRRIAMLYVDKTTKRLRAFKGMRLLDEFRRKAGP